MIYLRKKIEIFIKKSGRKNLYLAKWSYPTIWGGSTLLKMHLRAMKDLIRMKEKNLWPWEFVLNLSESDFPIKPVQELGIFLSKNKKKNFLKFFKSHYEK